MKLKKFTPMQRLAIILPLVMVIVAFLIASESYFNTVEIRETAKGCYDNGGLPIIETTQLNLNYSFSCNMD